jgi:hypothetical protein
MGTPIEPESVQGEIPDEGNNAPGPNPAWNDVLSILPEQFHPVVTPKFQEWDNAANTRIESLNSTLKEYEAYKPFVEHGISADELEQGVRLLFEINNNPQGVYEALANAYNLGQSANPPVAAGTANNEEPETPFDAANLPPEVMEKLNQHDGLLQAVSQIVLNDAQAKQAANDDLALEKELKDTAEKLGIENYDEDYILTKMLNNASAEEAFKSYQAMVQRLTPQPFAPSVIGGNNGGTGLPSNAIDPTKLSGKETRNLVAEMLAKAAQQNR